jgi:cytochrome c556
MRFQIKPVFVAGLAVLGLVACTPSVVEDTRPGQPVKQRQDAFKDILRHFEPMGVMLRDGAYEAERFEAMARALWERRESPWAHFGPDTHYPPSKSTAAVWEKPDLFQKERAHFLEQVETLMTVSASADENQIEKAYNGVYDSCKSCHRSFRR